MLNLSFKWQLMVIKKPKKKLSTKLNIRSTNTKYSSFCLTVPVAELLVYFPFDSSTRVRAASGVILFKKKKTDWKVTEMCMPFSRLNGNVMVTEMPLKSIFPVIIQSPFSHHSFTIQSTERWDFILWVYSAICTTFVLANFCILLLLIYFHRYGNMDSSCFWGHIPNDD